MGQAPRVDVIARHLALICNPQSQKTKSFPFYSLIHLTPRALMHVSHSVFLISHDFTGLAVRETMAVDYDFRITVSKSLLTLKEWHILN